MYRHMILFNSKDKDAVDKCCRDLIAHQDEIAGLLHAEYIENASPYGNGYDQLGVMDFVDQTAFDEWTKHPLHQSIREKLAEHTTRFSFDYLIP